MIITLLAALAVGCMAPAGIRRDLRRSDVSWGRIFALPPQVQAAVAEEEQRESERPGRKRFLYKGRDGSYRVYWYYPDERSHFWWNNVTVDADGRITGHGSGGFMP